MNETTAKIPLISALHCYIDLVFICSRLWKSYQQKRKYCINILHKQLIAWMIYSLTTMWAEAQRYGRPAECMWHPLFNATKFG